MSEAESDDEHPDGFQDPLTFELMEDPVILVETGHSYEHSKCMHLNS